MTFYIQSSQEKSYKLHSKILSDKGPIILGMSLFLDTFLGKNRIYPFRIFLNITLSDGSYQSFLLFGVNLLTGLSTRGTIAIFLKIHGQSHTYFEKNEMKSQRLIDFFFRFRAKEITSNHC